MRYIVADERPVSLENVRTAFAQADGGYDVDGEDGEATITHYDAPIAHLSLNAPGDNLFDDERDELIELAEDADERSARNRVVDTLRAARGIVAVQVLFGDGSTEGTLDLLVPLWTWLRANRHGLLQADGEGYYDGGELIFPLE